MKTLKKDRSILTLESSVILPLQKPLGAAVENILLEAVHLDLGAVWLGVATAEENVNYIKELFNLSENIKPFALIPIGYPDGAENIFVDRFNGDKVHYENWK